MFRLCSDTFNLAHADILDPNKKSGKTSRVNKFFWQMVTDVEDSHRNLAVLDMRYDIIMYLCIFVGKHGQKLIVVWTICPEDKSYTIKNDSKPTHVASNLKTKPFQAGNRIFFGNLSTVEVPTSFICSEFGFLQSYFPKLFKKDLCLFHSILF